MKRTYECMLLLDNREVKKGWDELKTTVGALFDKHGAEVVSARRWDERRLAFPIKRQKRATYLLMYFNAETPQVQAIRRDMEFSEVVLRNFMVGCEKIPEEAFEPEESFDVASIRIEDEPPVVSTRTEEKPEETAGKTDPEKPEEAAGKTGPEKPAAASGESGAEPAEEGTPAVEVEATGDKAGDGATGEGATDAGDGGAGDGADSGQEDEDK